MLDVSLPRVGPACRPSFRALSHFRRLWPARRFCSQNTRRGGDRGDADAGGVVAPPLPPAKRQSNRGISVTVRHTHLRVSGSRSSPARRAATLMRTQTAAPTVWASVTRRFFAGAPLQRNGTRSLLTLTVSTLSGRGEGWRTASRATPGGGLLSPVQPTPSSAASSPTCPLSSASGGWVTRVAPESASGKIIPSVGAGDASVPVGRHGQVFEARSLFGHRVRRRQNWSQAGRRRMWDKITVQPGQNHSHTAWNCDVSLRFSKSSRERNTWMCSPQNTCPLTKVQKPNAT